MYYVYVLKLENANDRKYYIGYSSDLRKRLVQHKNNLVKSTKNKKPILIYYEAFNDKYLALRREKGIKSSGSVYMSLFKRLGLK